MKQKRELAILAVLLFIAALVWLRVRESAPANFTASFVAQNYQPLAVENPSLHLDELRSTQKTEYKGTGRDPFSIHLPPPVPMQQQKLPQQQQQTVVYGPPVEPPPPPVTLPPNVKYFGYGTVPNSSSRRAFLTDGEGEVYVVAEGEVLLNRFRILKVGNATLEFEDLSTGRHGSAVLEEQGPSA